MKYILGGRMMKLPAELVVAREPLRGTPQASSLECCPEGIVIERSGCHQSGGFLSNIETVGGDPETTCARHTCVLGMA